VRLLDLQPGEHVLDIGAGTGVPAPAVARVGARYTGVDASPRLIDYARKQHGAIGRFLVGDARKLPGMRGLELGSFDAALFLLSIQDMDPLQPVLEAAVRMLKDGGRLVMMLTHPAFRVPRQSGWGWDAGRKLVYRRVDRYLTPLPVPMKPYPGSTEGATTRSFHRPMGMYVNGLAECGLCVDRLEELPAHRSVTGFGNPKAEKLAREEIPLFLAMRARKPGP
jgi:SAM-dependent methyltransferase